MRYSEPQIFSTTGTHRKGNLDRAMRRQGIESARQQRKASKQRRRELRERAAG